MVVVYKVDRLTRSLADFAKMVEIFDAKGVSFVSVTQAVQHDQLMGRLTLNVLLSFAQFEREVTGERIRDKIAASKRKGMWMGGVVPLGYDVVDRKLVVNEAEAGDGSNSVRSLPPARHHQGSARGSGSPRAPHQGSEAQQRQPPGRRPIPRRPPQQAAEQPDLHRRDRPQG